MSPPQMSLSVQLFLRNVTLIFFPAAAGLFVNPAFFGALYLASTELISDVKENTISPSFWSSFDLKYILDNIDASLGPDNKGGLQNCKKDGLFS